MADKLTRREVLGRGMVAGSLMMGGGNLFAAPETALPPAGPWEGFQVVATAEQIGIRDGRRIHGRTPSRART